MYGEGISRFGELLDIAVTLELVNKSGSWFSVGSNVEAVFGSGRRPHDLLGFERIMRATARSLRFPHVKSSC